MLSPRTVAGMAAYFQLGGVIGLTGPVARGEVGEVFRLETTAGSWAVKRPFTRCDPADVHYGAGFADVARANGVPSPAVRRGPSGEVVLDTEDGQLSVYEWVELADPDPTLDPVAVGRLVAGLHRTSIAGGGSMDGWYTEPVGAARWAELVDQLTAADAPFAGDLARLRTEIIALEALIEPAQVLQSCHRDLWADNLRQTTSGELCVMDWDGAGLAEPSQELCLMLYEFGGGSAFRTRELYAAYCDAGGPGRVSGPADFSMVIAQLVHINERACSRWLASSPGSAERDRMAALFGEFVERPLTRAVIDETVDAVRG